MAAVSASSEKACLRVTHAACLRHDIHGHPEQPARLGSIIDALEVAFRDVLLKDSEPPAATDEQLQYFHSKAHVNKVKKACRRATSIHEKAVMQHGAAAVAEAGRKLRRKLEVEIDGDTSVVFGSEDAALRAVGSVIAAVDAVCSDVNGVKNAFCAVRPPGHHAEPSGVMGFCLFGNVGIGAHHARREHGLRRIACVDWDVHHGNGTQAGFEKDPDLFFASSHQIPCYPGTGDPSETGVAENVVNVGLQPGSGSEEFSAAWRDSILPKLKAFDPELIFVSAGFDAHGDDPLAQVNLSDEDYYWVQREIMLVADEVCSGRVVSVLEGGYDLNAIARSAVECMRAQVESAKGPTYGGDQNILDAVLPSEASDQKGTEVASQEPQEERHAISKTTSAEESEIEVITLDLAATGISS